MSHALNVSLATFESEVLNSEIPVVIDFYADWCGPCRMLGPILDRISDKYAQRAKVVKVNIDHEQALAQQFDVSAVPTLAFVLHGEIVGEAQGLVTESDLSSVVEQLIEMN